MTLDEAIDCLSEEAQAIYGLDVDYRLAAIKLGIQSLKIIKRIGKYKNLPIVFYLKGETRD